MTLRELPVGSIFKSAKSKKGTLYKKIGDPEFNRSAGTATCRCLNKDTGFPENKQARLEVTFISDKPAIGF